MAEMNKSVAQCAPCLKSGIRQNASVHCDTCDQFQCQECFCVHELYDFMAGHTFKDLLTPMSLVRAQSKDLLSCDVHNKPYEIFCDDHQFLCCSYCAVESHRSCEHVRAVGQQAQSIIIKPSDIVKRIKVSKACVSKASDSINAICKSLHTQLLKISSRLNSVKNKAILDDASKKSTDGRLEEMIKIEEYKEDYLDTLCTNIQELLVFYKELVFRGDIRRCFVKKCTVHRRLADIVKELESCFNGFRQIDVSVSVDHTLTNINKMDAGFAIKFSKCSFKHIPNVSRCLPLQCVKLQHGSLKLKQHSKNTFFNGIDFLRDGKLVTTEKNSRLVVVVNENLEEVASTKLKWEPLDVVAINENKMVVSVDEYYTLSVIDIDSSDNLVPGYVKGRIFDMDSFYNSICKYSDDTVVVGPALRKRIAQKFNFITGQMWRFESDLPRKEWKLLGDAATVAFIKSRNLLIVAVRRQNLIYICDVSDSTSDHITVTDIDNDIQDPRGMAVGPNDCIFVCCYKSHTIVQISPGGHILCVYQLRDLFYPTDVCFSTDGKKMFVLSNTVDQNVFAYELS